MNLLKTLALSSSIFLLSGCAVVASLYDAYFMSKFDNQEYRLLNEIRTLAEISADDCSNNEQSKTNFFFLYVKTTELKNYAQYIPNNKDTLEISNNIFSLAKQGKEAYSASAPSQAFCKLKLQQIVRATEISQKAIGNKPR